MTAIDTLLKMKKQIAKDENIFAMETGKLQVSFETLHNEFGIKTLKEANKLLKEMDEKFALKSKQADANVKTLEDKYNWNFDDE